MMRKLKEHQHVVHVVTLATVFGHIFCCGLPLLTGVLGLFAGLGALSPAIPALHEQLHRFEIPLIVFSALMVALGWIVYLHGTHVDCHDSGCHHPPCGTRKKRASWLLILATGLFAVNLGMVLIAHHH